MVFDRMGVGFDNVWMLNWQVWSLYCKDSWYALEIAEFPLYTDYQIKVFHNLEDGKFLLVNAQI